MPFRSEAQRRYMWANHPEIAQEWENKYGSKPQPAPKPAAKKKSSPKKRG